MRSCCGHGSRPLSRDEAPLEQPAQRLPAREVYLLGGRHMRDADLTEDERHAYNSPHHCTDFLCLMIFIASLAALGHIMVYAYENGDPRRLYHGLDFYGDLCGVDPNVVQKPFLFWCTEAGRPLEQARQLARGDLNTVILGSTAHLDLQHPICVESCPLDSSTHHSCYQGETSVRGEPDTEGSFTKNTTYTFRFVEDYETFPLHKQYCMPAGTAMMTQLRETLGTGQQATLDGLSSVGGAWVALLTSAALAIALGYMYLFSLNKLAGCLIHLTLLFATLLPILAGLFFLYGVYGENVDETYLAHLHVDAGKVAAYTPSTGDKQWDTIIGWGLIALGMLIALTVCCLWNSIEFAIGCVEAASDALFDMPSLLLQPFLHVIGRLCLLAALGVGLAWILSCGNVKRYDVTSHVPGGISRSFHYEEIEKVYIAVYVFVAIWILNIDHAMQEFIIAYASQLWYFKEYVNGDKTVAFCPIARGFCIGATFHLGTLALGAFILSLFQIVYAVLYVIYKRAEEAAEDATSSSVVKCCAACCCCCLQCWERLIRFMSKNAYIVTAIDSEPFWPACQVAFNVITHEAVAIGSLNGACWIFQLGGIVSITGLGVYLTWLLVQNVPLFSDPTSEHFVSNPEAVCAVAAGICFIIAAAFMVVFDTVADTILFCWALDKKHQMETGRPQRNNVPPRLQALLDKHAGPASDPLLTRAGANGYVSGGSSPVYANGGSPGYANGGAGYHGSSNAGYYGSRTAVYPNNGSGGFFGSGRY